jgi:hypothetical protein
MRPAPYYIQHVANGLFNYRHSKHVLVHHTARSASPFKFHSSAFATMRPGMLRVQRKDLGQYRWKASERWIGMRLLSLTLRLVIPADMLFPQIVSVVGKEEAGSVPDIGAVVGETRRACAISC